MSKKYPSRAAHKLLFALEKLREHCVIDISQRVCLDLGSAQGGFVHVLLDEGARCVYAVDVAYGILDYNLRTNKSVIPKERKNLRSLSPAWFRQEDYAYLLQKRLRPHRQALFCTCDVSFISSAAVLNVLSYFHKQTQIPIELMLLIKPQFEASKWTQKGILSDAALRQSLVDRRLEDAAKKGFSIQNCLAVEPKGRQGNQEYMLYAQLASDLGK